MMSTFVIAIENIEDIPVLKEAGYDEFVVAVKGASFSPYHSYTFEELPKDANLSLWMNRFLFPSDMEEIKDLFQQAISFGFQHIYFHDPSILQIALANHQEGKLIYRPETLVTNRYDVKWWLSQGISSISLSNVLNETEINEIVKEESRVELTIHGHTFLSASKRRLVHAFEEKTEDIYHGVLKEDKRQEPMLLYEEKQGTIIYSDQILQSFEQMKHWTQQDRYFVEGYQLDTTHLCDAIKLYKRIQSGEMPEEEIKDFLQKYSKGLSSGYYEENYIK